MQQKPQSLMRLFLIDDCPLFAAGVKTSLGVRQGISFVGSASCTSEALSIIKVLKPDVAICSIDCVSVGSRREWIQTLLQEVPRSIVLATKPTTIDIIEGYQLGLLGFFDKRIPIEELAKAITLAFNRSPYFVADVAVEMVRHSILGASTELGVESMLTPDELQMLRYVGDGLTEVEIAGITKKAKRTVTYQKARLKEIFGVTRPSSFTKICIKHGLIDIDDLV